LSPLFSLSFSSASFGSIPQAYLAIFTSFLIIYLLPLLLNFPSHQLLGRNAVAAEKDRGFDFLYNTKQVSPSVMLAVLQLVSFQLIYLSITTQ
jgi:hypothetical protein